MACAQRWRRKEPGALADGQGRGLLILMWVTHPQRSPLFGLYDLVIAAGSPGAIDAAIRHDRRLALDRGRADGEKDGV
jgi:hypothetical protein